MNIWTNWELFLFLLVLPITSCLYCIYSLISKYPCIQILCLWHISKNKAIIKNWTFETIKTKSYSWITLITTSSESSHGKVQRKSSLNVVGWNALVLAFWNVLLVLHAVGQNNIAEIGSNAQKANTWTDRNTESQEIISRHEKQR